MAILIVFIYTVVLFIQLQLKEKYSALKPQTVVSVRSSNEDPFPWTMYRVQSRSEFGGFLKMIHL